MDTHSSEDLLSDFVHVDFKRFVDADSKGNEHPDSEARGGYLIYNDHRQDFGFGTFNTSDDYTVDADVLEFVKTQHPDFMPFITSTSGLYINGTWHVVSDHSGRIRH